MEVALHTLGLYYETKPSDPSSRNPQRVRHRITSLELNDRFRHTKTLQCLELCHTSLFALLLDEEAYRSFNLDEMGDPDSDDDNEEQSNTKTPERKPKLIVPKDDTWFSVFERLTKLPSLTSV
jgi:hypothetical protein